MLRFNVKEGAHKIPHVHLSGPEGIYWIAVSWADYLPPTVDPLVGLSVVQPLQLDFSEAPEPPPKRVRLD